MNADDSSLIAEYFGYESRWLSTRPGERIHYLDEGRPDGTPVVLLHGSAIGITAAANFYLTIPALVAAGHRVIAPDLYGYGFTETPGDLPAVRPNQVDLVIRVLDALELPNAYVVGNSLGGWCSPVWCWPTLTGWQAGWSSGPAERGGTPDHGSSRI